MPAALDATLAPVREVLRQLTQTLTTLDEQLHTRAVGDPVTQRLLSAPGVGPVVALTFQAVLDTPARFGGDAARASAFLGLVPQEYSSGESHRKGAITKAGPGDAAGAAGPGELGGLAREAAGRGPRYGRGRTASPRGAGARSRSWRWRGASVACCWRSGATGPCFANRRRR